MKPEDEPKAKKSRQFPVDTLIHIMNNYYYQENEDLQAKLDYYMQENASMCNTIAKKNRSLEMYMNTETLLFRELDMYVNILHQIFDENDTYRQRFARLVLFDDLPVEPNLMAEDSDAETVLEELNDDDIEEAIAHEEEDHRRLQRILFDTDTE